MKEIPNSYDVCVLQGVKSMICESFNQGFHQCPSIWLISITSGFYFNSKHGFCWIGSRLQVRFILFSFQFYFVFRCFSFCFQLNHTHTHPPIHAFTLHSFGDLNMDTAALWGLFRQRDIFASPQKNSLEMANSLNVHILNGDIWGVLVSLLCEIHISVPTKRRKRNK